MKLRGWMICFLAALFYSYEYLLRIEPSVLTVVLKDFYGLSFAGLGLLSSAYYFAYSPLQLGVGVILDKFGPRKTLIIALFACILGSFIFSLTHLYSFALAGRFLIGAGSAFAFVGALKLAAVWLPEKYFGFFAGVVTALGMLGAISADTLLSYFVREIGWHKVLVGATFFGVILLILFFAFLKDVPEERRYKRFYKLVKHSSSDFPNQSTSVISAFIRIAKSPQLWLCGFVASFLYLSLSIFAEMWAVPFINSWGGKFVSNWMSLPLEVHSTIVSFVFVGWLVGAPVMGLLSGYVKERRFLLMAGSVLSTVFICIVMYGGLTTVWSMELTLFLFGFFNSVQVTCFAFARFFVTKRYAATAIAFVNFLVMLLPSFFQPLVGKIIDWAWTGGVSEGVKFYKFSTMQHALIILPIGFVLATFLAFFLKKPVAHKKGL